MFVEYWLCAHYWTKCLIHIFWFYVHISPVIIGISVLHLRMQRLRLSNLAERWDWNSSCLGSSVLVLLGKNWVLGSKSTERKGLKYKIQTCFAVSTKFLLVSNLWIGKSFNASPGWLLMFSLKLGRNFWF